MALAALLHGHLSNVAQLAKIEGSLNSVIHQNHKIPVYIGVTIPDSLWPIHEHIKTKLVRPGVTVHTFRSNERPPPMWIRRQLLDLADHPWYIFGHIADIWHPKRTEIYQKAIENTTPEVQAIYVPLMLRPQNKTIHSLVEAEEALANQQAVITAEETIGKVEQYVCRRSLLLSWYAKITDFHLGYDLNDLLFLRYMRIGGAKLMEVNLIRETASGTSVSSWMYHGIYENKPAKIPDSLNNVVAQIVSESPAPALVSQDLLHIYNQIRITACFAQSKDKELFNIPRPPIIKPGLYQSYLHKLMDHPEISDLLQAPVY